MQGNRRNALSYEANDAVSKRFFNQWQRNDLAHDMMAAVTLVDLWLRKLLDGLSSVKTASIF